MSSVDRNVGPQQLKDRSAGELSQIHHSVCSARYERRHGHSTDSAHRGGKSVHERRHAVSSRYLNNAALVGQQVDAPHPVHRQVITCMVVTVVLGLAYIAVAGIFWSDINSELFWAGLLLIVLGGAVCENAIRFDAVHGKARSTGRNAVGQQ